MENNDYYEEKSEKAWQQMKYVVILVAGMLTGILIDYLIFGG